MLVLAKRIDLATKLLKGHVRKAVHSFEAVRIIHMTRMVDLPSPSFWRRC
jgi:hypothetical protein